MRLELKDGEVLKLLFIVVAVVSAFVRIEMTTQATKEAVETMGEDLEYMIEDTNGEIEQIKLWQAAHER